MKTNLKLQKTDQWLPNAGQGTKIDSKREGGSFWGDGYVLYRGHGVDFISVFICQNLLNCTLSMGVVYCMYIVTK